MKLTLMTLLTIFALCAEAGSFRDLLPILIGGGKGPDQSGQYGRPGQYRPGHPGGNPERPYRPNPGYGGGGGGAYSCSVNDRGHEEHYGGHGSCGECLQRHGECIETCSASATECRVEGRDRYGNLVSFTGSGRDRWSAESDGIRACQYNYASNCYVTGCNQRNEVVSRRSCR